MGVNVELLLPVDHHVENSYRHSSSPSEGPSGISLGLHGRDQLSNAPLYWLLLLSFTLPGPSSLVTGIAFQINYLHISPYFMSCIWEKPRLKQWTFQNANLILILGSSPTSSKPFNSLSKFLSNNETFCDWQECKKLGSYLTLQPHLSPPSFLLLTQLHWPLSALPSLEFLYPGTFS